MSMTLSLRFENYEAYDSVAYGLRIAGKKKQAELIYHQIFDLLLASSQIESEYIHSYLASHYYETRQSSKA